MLKITRLKLDLWTDIIIFLYQNKDTKLQDILRITGFSFAYVINILQIFERDKLITRKVVGRTKEIRLTDKGKELARLMLKVNSIIGVQ